MTDPLTPNDLSHLSDDEFNALCPQGEHAPGSEPLSPAALAVWDAAWDCPIGDCRSVAEGRRHQIAAALRAAADQLCLRWSELSHPADVLNNIAAELEA